MGNNVFMRWRMNLEKQIDRVGVREGEGERKGEGEREGEGVGDVGEEDDLLTTMREEESSNLFQTFCGV